ncbi:hypothetical protein [Nocardia brasiliensis]|uniref:hypothetical protein n=1 Tax=Nocardia brasiliensis TaxID=37326 RepID=UPI002455F7E7|nr:hypothetical protein [Nocardia brasiliensis]
MNRRELLGDLLVAGRAGLESGSPDRLASALAAWRDTAAAYADSSIQVDGSDLHYLDEPVSASYPD